MNDLYKCDCCNEEWRFCPEDYDNPKDWPTICPMCSMPWTQLIHDTLKYGGLTGIVDLIKITFKRLTYERIR